MTINITIAGTAYPVPSSAADTNWAADQVAFEQAVAAALAPPTWLAPSFTNSWVNSGTGTQTAGYWKDANGTVHLRGTIKSGTNGTSAFTLPAGYRPLLSEYFLILMSGGVGEVVVAADGTVTVINLTGTGATLSSLAALSFSTV